MCVCVCVQANEVLLGGHKLTAVEAQERGLVTRVIPTQHFQETVDELVSKMAALPPKVCIMQLYQKCSSFEANDCIIII